VANTTGDGGVTCKQILNIRFFTSEDNIISFTVAKKKKKIVGGYDIFLSFNI
jgi:hypothetical protein